MEKWVRGSKEICSGYRLRSCQDMDVQITKESVWSGKRDDQRWNPQKHQWLKMDRGRGTWNGNGE